MMHKGYVKAGVLHQGVLRHPSSVRMNVRVVSPAISVTVWHRLPPDAVGTFLFPVNPNITINNVFTSNDVVDDVATIDPKSEMLRYTLPRPAPVEIVVMYTMPLASTDKFRIWLPYGLPDHPVALYVTIQSPVPHVANVQGMPCCAPEQLASVANMVLNVHASRPTGAASRTGFLSLAGVSVRLVVAGYNFVNLVPGTTRGNADWTIHARPQKKHVKLTFTREALYPEADYRDSMVLRCYAAYVLTRNRDMVAVGRALCAALMAPCLFAPTVKTRVHSRKGSAEYLSLSPDYPNGGDDDPGNQRVVIGCLRHVLDGPIELLDPPACLVAPSLL